MLFHSSIRKELARSFGATLVALITIVMTMMLVRTLGLASRGSVNPSDVMLVLGYTILSNLATILTLSLFVATVASLSRMYRDSEMVIWFAAGRGQLRLLAPLLRFAWPVLLVVIALAFLVWPWSNRQIQDLKDRYERRGDIERITPGQFQESASGTRVFFIDKDSPDSRNGNNVFISAVERGKESVTSARSARVEIKGEDRFITLNSGQRLETSVTRGDLKLTEFSEYWTRIGASELSAPDTVPVKTRTTATLLMEPTAQNRGELSWRIGLALAAFNFVLIALAVATGNPRSARSGALLVSLLTFIVYYNLITLGSTWIASGKTVFAVYVIGLHGGVMALAWLWLVKRHNNWTVRSWFQRMTGNRKAGAA
jgi:lipopolysaccharide export system permease protein